VEADEAIFFSSLLLIVPVFYLSFLGEAVFGITSQKNLQKPLEKPQQIDPNTLLTWWNFTKSYFPS